VVSGRVQGVGFRSYVLREARALGLSGWVRNLPGGEVEVEAHGPEPALLGLLDALRRGPVRARVDECNPQWWNPASVPDDFEITG
jgi:acylphosphatase